MRWILPLLLSASLFGQVSILTAHVDNSRTGANLSETTLTPSNVNTTTFGKLGNFTVDGDIYAQPLYVAGVTISAVSHNLLIVSTMNNTIYAFDADDRSTLWSVNFGATTASYPSAVLGPLFYGKAYGCVSAPVVDDTKAYIYSVCSGIEQWTLRKLDITTGSTLASVVIAGRYPGSGDPQSNNTSFQPTTVDTSWPPVRDRVVNGYVYFYPVGQMQRAPLTFANGNVYIAFGSQADTHPYHGWAFAYRADDLTQIGVFCTTPSTYGGGLWGASGGMSVDGRGFLYAATGNGTFDAGTGAYGESILKFDPFLNLVDYFTPSNWSTLNTADSDLSSGRVMLIPGSTKTATGAKDYRVYSVDRSCLGHLQGSGCSNQQIFFTNSGGTVTDHSGIYGGTFYNNKAYFPNTNGKIYIFTFDPVTQLFNTTPTSTTVTYEFPGAQMSASGNGSSNGIIWGTVVGFSALYSTQAATLKAWRASDFTEIWSSSTLVADNLGSLAKYVAPVVVNGKVYVATQSGYITAYGLR